MRSTMSPKEPKYSIGFGYNYGDMQTPSEIVTHCDPKIFLRVHHSTWITTNSVGSVNKRWDGNRSFLDNLKTLHFVG